ncbi:acyl CoA:acetate/3-ketoacid CoA transferase [Methylobacterium nodulans]|uniref:Coenzyme A transferase n=1 Tax=Methylobacterium nodulans (strain LMG 21967 / CNCM I-2342 / ORS 2060) TaxID=460265 RepID=B8IE99_METNO|nr:acyl CoA:acetate/3-ketoacid CoA transferase [Methylobacterium nodulans]ACL57645.1 coenzyme A transferase [Methylobacterium nodulans ORS 2060]
MTKSKIISADEAIALVRDGDVVTTTGFVQSCIPEALHAALEKRFVESGAPRGLTLIMTAGAGDSKGLGTGRLHHDGLLRRVIGANFGRMPKVAQAAQENKILAYNLPQGVISQLFRACAAGQPGLFSKVGLKTYVDPRHGGGRVNTITKDEIVKLVEVDGEEWLFYTATKIDVAFIRGTSADPSGNICMAKEALTLDNLAQAMAARNNGGIVIAQVERIVEQGSIKPKDVRVPGMLVDCVVVAEPEMHRMNYGVMHDAALAGEIRVPAGAIPKMPLDSRKIIARRSAFELPPNGVVNLGVGAPEGISSIAAEEKVTPYITLTTEAGAVGGVLASGSSFGAATNADCIIDQNQMFDFYDGGGLDMTCLGMAECDRAGNVNTSRFGGRLNGCGGFINISQNARKVVFAGTFTAGGLVTKIEDGRLRIVQEGRSRKFVEAVEQNTFSGPFAQERDQPVLYVTERCVFNLTKRGLELIEVAPGIDIGRDILAHMDFMPVIENPIPMDQRIFRDKPMELLADLLNLNLSERVSYDAERNLLFVNLEGWQVRSTSDIDALRQVLETACLKAGQRVNSVVNHDGFRISENLYDAYAEMIEYLCTHHYLTTTRYSTSAFLRLKMQEALSKRGLAPHIFERKEEAHAFLNAVCPT